MKKTKILLPVLTIGLSSIIGISSASASNEVPVTNNLISAETSIIPMISGMNAFDGDAGFGIISGTKVLLGEYEEYYDTNYIFDGSCDLGWLTKEIYNGKLRVYANFTYDDFHRYYRQEFGFEYAFYY